MRKPARRPDPDRSGAGAAPRSPSGAAGPATPARHHEGADDHHRGHRRDRDRPAEPLADGQGHRPRPQQRPQDRGRALEHREEALNYAMQFARDMDTDLADKFVGMYVNSWTLSYGERGRSAVQELLDRGFDAGLIPGPAKAEFLSESAE